MDALSVNMPKWLVVVTQMNVKVDEVALMSVLVTFTPVHHSVQDVTFNIRLLETEHVAVVKQKL